MVGAARRLATELVVIMASATHEIHAVVGTFAFAVEAAIGCSAGMSIAVIRASWCGVRTLGTHAHAARHDGGSPAPGELVSRRCAALARCCSGAGRRRR